LGPAFTASIELTTIYLLQVACNDKHRRHEWLVFLHVRTLSPCAEQRCVTRAANSDGPTLSASLRALVAENRGSRAGARPCPTSQNIERSRRKPSSEDESRSCFGDIHTKTQGGILLGILRDAGPLLLRSAAADAVESFCHRTSRRSPQTGTSSCNSLQVHTDSGLTYTRLAALLCGERGARAEAGRTLTLQERTLCCMTCGERPWSHYSAPHPPVSTLPHWSHWPCGSPCRTCSKSRDDGFCLCRSTTTEQVDPRLARLSGRSSVTGEMARWQVGWARGSHLTSEVCQWLYHALTKH
jgi:hypothetical protein